MNGINHQFTFGIREEVFNRPTGIAEFQDRIVVSDEALDRVQVFDASGALDFVIGMRGDGPGEFVSPRGVVANGDRIYVADEGNNRVQAFDDNGAFLWMTAPNDLNRPFDVAIVGDVVAIADANNGRIVVLDEHGDRVSEAPGLNWPRALTSGGAFAQLYVLDNNEVLTFEKVESEQPMLRWTIPPPIVTGTNPYGRPWGIAFDEVNQRVVVSDQGGPVLHSFEPDGTPLPMTWSYGTGKNQFHDPQGLSASGRGVLVADHGNSRVVSDEWDLELGGVPQPAGHVHLPSDVAYSKSSKLVYVADTENGRVQAFSDDGQSQFTFGEIDLTSPTGVAVGDDFVVAADPLGTQVKVVVYGLDGVFDRAYFITSIPSVQGFGLANQCRAAIDPNSQDLLLTFRGLGTVGRYDSMSGAPIHVYDVTVGTTSSGGTPISPTDVVAGPNGTVFVGDPDGRRVVQLTSTGRYEEFRDPTIDMRPETVVYDENRNLLITGDGDTIRTIDLRRGRIAERSARGAGDGEFRGISAMTLRDELLYVAERLNTRIQAITLD